MTTLFDLRLITRKVAGLLPAVTDKHLAATTPCAGTSVGALGLSGRDPAWSP